jgi:isopenicillin-N epimerase
MPDAYWTAARNAMMLDPTVTMLNTGSFGPLPRVVFDRVTEIRWRLAAGPTDFFVRQLPPLLADARRRLADFVGADRQRLVFTENVTSAVNLVAASLRLAAPGEVLLTDHEYGAMHWCWERAAQRQGLTLGTFALPQLPVDPREVVDAACAAMTDRTRLLFFSHVLSPTGLVLPARELCAEARRRGVLTVVDGAHAPAFVAGLNVEAIGADFYGANCHKWLLAPTGSGFLYLGPGSFERVQPLQVSWGWRPDRSKFDEPDEFGSTPRLRYLEFEGTRDVCPWLAVPAAIDFQTGLGLDRIQGRIRELARYTRERLSGTAGLTLATPEDSRMYGAMTAFRVPPGCDPAELRTRLWERRIEVPAMERPDRVLVRASTHFYNTESEIDTLADALEAILPA